MWRERPFDEEEIELLRRVEIAHIQSAYRNNVSSNVCSTIAIASESYTNSIIGAIASLGAKHGPIEDAYDFLIGENPPEMATIIAKMGGKIPGWGNSFIKGEHDPFWLPVREALAQFYPSAANLIDMVTESLHDAGKQLYPNPACYTAMTAILVELPKTAASYLFIKSRLDAWTEIFLSSTVKMDQPEAQN